MASKSQVQTVLKEKYGINNNISDVLDKEECERLLTILDHEPIAVKLVESFAEKNSTLRKNNASLGSRRYHAETKLSSLQSEYLQLQESIKNIEIPKSESTLKKKQLEQETRKIEENIKQVTTENKNLKTQLEALNQSNQNLSKVNLQLEKENQELKSLEDELFLLQKENEELQESIDNIEILKSESTLRKQELEQETRLLVHCGVNKITIK